jgi:hypothetical protein
MLSTVGLLFSLDLVAVVLSAHQIRARLMVEKQRRAQAR